MVSWTKVVKHGDLALSSIHAGHWGAYGSQKGVEKWYFSSCKYYLIWSLYYLWNIIVIIILSIKMKKQVQTSSWSWANMWQPKVLLTCFAPVPAPKFLKILKNKHNIVWIISLWFYLSLPLLTLVQLLRGFRPKGSGRKGRCQNGTLYLRVNYTLLGAEPSEMSEILDCESDACGDFVVS